MISRRSASGILDLETSLYALSNGNYTVAYNINVSSDGSVSPVDGNRIVNWDLPVGNNMVIGFKPDLVRGRAFIFVFNDYYDSTEDPGIQYNRSQILIYDIATRSISLLIEDQTDTGGVSILGFANTNPILHIDILYRDENEGDILSWTDGATRPKELLIDKVLSGAYGVVTIECIEAAKRPPLNAPTNSYFNEPARTINSMRKKLFQFKYRWVYDDFSKSTWSPIGKMPLPIDIFYEPDNDIDPGYNCGINVTVATGTKNVARIEVAGRVSIGNGWSDFFLIDSIDKAALSIGDNTTTTYKFYNDAVYPYVDLRESLLLFDWAPRKAFAQCLANGNVKVYMNILENYNRITELDIRVTTDEVLNNPEDEGGFEPAADMVWSSEPQLPGELQVGYLDITGDPIPGTRYVVYWKSGPLSYQEIFLDYTAVSGDTNEDIADAFAAQQPDFVVADVPLVAGDGRVQIAFDDPGQSFYSEEVISAPAGTVEGYQGTWPWWSRYYIGVVYFDEHGWTNGPYFDKTLGRDNSDVTTTPYNEDGTIPYTPYLDVLINHEPPPEAVKYQLVRSRNLVMDDFLFWRSDDYHQDSDFLYFSIEDLVLKRSKQQSYVPNWDFAEGDRIRVVIDNVGVTRTLIPSLDFLVVGFERLDLGAGEKLYVKVNKPATVPTLNDDQLIMLWRPTRTGGDVEEEVYYEFGEVYDIYTIGDTKYHRGSTQDQTSIQAARHIIREGDVFYRKRAFTDAASALYICDENYSDDFASIVNSNGRPHAVDFDVRETWFETMSRFSLEYQKGTSINQINRFYFDNLDEYDRQYGSVQKIRVNDRTIRVFQELKCGVVPVYQQIITDTVGSDVISQSDRILNSIQYYAGDFGIGKHPESHASFGLADYFVDKSRGTPCRLSLNGITPLAIDWNMHPYFVQRLRNYDDDANLCGAFDVAENRYMLRLPSIGEGDPTVVIAFNEDKRGFEAFYEFDPEFMGSLGTVLFSFSFGSTWTHDSDTKANFFGSQKRCRVGFVFNDLPTVKKTFQNVTYVARTRWYVSEAVTSLDKQSRVPLQHFRKKEDAWHAPLLRDQDSLGGLLGGAVLKGNWILCIFEQYDQGQDDEFQYAEVKYIESKLNAR